jgi:hypothetical protein
LWLRMATNNKTQLEAAGQRKVGGSDAVLFIGKDFKRGRKLKSRSTNTVVVININNNSTNNSSNNSTTTESSSSRMHGSSFLMVHTFLLAIVEALIIAFHNA